MSAPRRSQSALSCPVTREHFSDYLDGTASGQLMLQLAAHLEICPGCAAEFATARVLQRTLSSLAPVRPPADLDRRLRVAVSQQRACSWSATRNRLQMRWENALRPLLLQASAGLACAVVLLGSILFLLGLVAAPRAVMANDEPLGAITAPHYLYSMVEPHPIHTDQDETIVVEVRVNDRGLVYDYTIVSGPTDPAVQSQIAEQLLATVFQPASVFGGPVRGRAIVTFAGVSVHA